MARVIDHRGDSRGVAKRWKQQYFNSGRWYTFGESGSAEDIYKAIVAAKGNAELIEQAIGNTSWTRVHCDSCDRRVELAIRLKKADSIFEYIVLCSRCINRAEKSLQRVRGGAA